METISELRSICQKRTTSYYVSPWVERHIHRTVSIYITKFFLTLGLSANQATLIGFIFGIIGSTMMAFTDPLYWVLSGIILYIYVLIDHSDGEIARYRKSASIFGRYFDDISGTFIRLYFLVCFSIGIYRIFSCSVFLIIGLITILFSSVFYLANSLPSQILYENKNVVTIEFQENKQTRALHFLMELGRNVLSLDTLSFFWIILAGVIDYYISPWIVEFPFSGGINFDVRSIFFSILSIALIINSCVGIILKGRYIFRIVRK
jgi:phosphatidylglycerophosphate synthase